MYSDAWSSLCLGDYSSWESPSLTFWNTVLPFAASSVQLLNIWNLKVRGVFFDLVSFKSLSMCDATELQVVFLYFQLG